MPWSPLPNVLRASVFTLMIVLVHGVISATPAAAQLVVAIEANPGVAIPGEQLEVRITVANQGASNVAGVSLNLSIPAELDSFPTGVATPGAGGCNQIVNDFTCQTGETLTWNLGTIVAGQSVTASLTPIVSAGAVGPITFNPVLNSGPSASATVTLNPALTLDVSLHEVADPVAAGDELAYTLHYGNRSIINTAPNALLRLPLPTGTTFVSASGGGVLNGSAVEWSLGTLQPGQSGTRSVTLDTSAGLVRGASILANAELSDTTPQLARARALTEIDGLEALELAMVVGPDPAAPGEQLEIELTVSNRSASNLATVTLLLRWPHQIDSLLTAQGTSGPGGCNQIVNDFNCTAGEFATWNLGTLNAGQSVTVSYSADLAAGAPDGAIVDFRATVYSSTFDDRTESGRAIAVDATSALDVSLHEAADPIAAGDDLAYTLHFGNRSTTDPAPNALLRLPLPAGTTFVSASGGGVLNGGAVEWSLGTLAPGQSGTRSVTLASAAGLVDGNAAPGHRHALGYFVDAAARAGERLDRDRRPRGARARAGRGTRSGGAGRAARDRAHREQSERIQPGDGHAAAALAASDRFALDRAGHLGTGRLQPDRQQFQLHGRGVRHMEPRHAERGSERDGLLLGGSGGGRARRRHRRFPGDGVQHGRR